MGTASAGPSDEDMCVIANRGLNLGYYLRPSGPHRTTAQSARACAAQVVHKCWTKITGFYEVCEQTFEQGTPGV